MARRRRLVALVAALPLLLAARYYPLPPEDVLLADNSGHEAGETFTIGNGEAVLSNPVGMSKRVTLLDAVEARTPGLTKTFAAGERLMHVRMWATGRLLASLPQDTSYYCQPLPNPQTGGFWESPSLIRTSICFFDRDNDNVLDGAFWGKAQHDADQVLVPIPPTRIRVEPNVPMGEESTLRLVFSAPNDPGGRLRFDLVYTSCGQQWRFDRLNRTPQQTTFRPTFPRTLTVVGAEVTVLGYDAANRTAQVRIERTITPGSIGREPLLVGPRVCF